VNRTKQKRRRLTLSQEETSASSPVTKILPKIIIGTNAGGTMKAAKTLKKKKVYFLGNFSTNETIDIVKDWCTDLNNNVQSIFSVKTKFKESQSFNICVDAEYKRKFSNIENWPCDVIVREWIHKEKKNNLSENIDSVNII